jgi:adenylate cyclase
MNNHGFVTMSLVLVGVIVYLFVSAPPALPEEEAAAGKLIPIETVLAMVAAENDVVRSLYTREIVGAGPQVGLAFGEEWQKEGFEQGPLPALFLREAASSLEKSAVPMSLFLGSDFPISPSNYFTGEQAETFEELKASGAPQYFYDDDTGRYTAMFPDLASVEPCVVCHNQHPDSPKTDWVLDDVMGATTWTYPRKAVTADELVSILSAVRASFRTAYSAYLVRAEAFSQPPTIGDTWPRDGYYLPTADVFMAEFERRASDRTLATLVAALDDLEGE